ncbi:BCCT family transporter [Cohnella hongkongensis]|uniref:BCCT family transporter n=1 Tax=Cohnella hongkongensis TaxID=178337 RepID=A0ABV9FMD2_9BACL
MKNKTWNNPVFWVSASILVVLVLLGGLLPESFGRVAGVLFDFTTINFGWFYLLSVFIIILFLAGLALSKAGGIRLGGEEERPEFPFFTWIGMLFSAGFGVGLVFWGVAEPMSHYVDTPFAGLEGRTVEAARVAMGYSFFHWGISQWSVYALVGLIIGFMQYRKQKDGLISTALEPIAGHRPGMKNTIDSFAVIATVMGVATSIGLGALQMNGGLNAVFGTGTSFWIQLAVIAVVFAAYMLSSTTGLNKGIRYLSNLNLIFAIVLLLFVFVTGPTLFILETFTLAIGDYISNFIGYSLRLQPYQGGTWVRDWTIFYWAWAISWSPFVGAFVARVSKGRTIREFIMGVMTVPPAIACFWIAAFGGTALWNDANRNAGIADAVQADVSSALFKTFEQMPFTMVVSILSILLILTFLVTSADSATYIMSSMTSKGSPNPPRVPKLVWGVLMSAIAGVLLYAGGLNALQTASLISALPFTLLLLLLGLSIAKLLRKEPLPIRKADLKRFLRLEKVAKEEKKK